MNDQTWQYILQLAPIIFAAGLIVRELRELAKTSMGIQKKIGTLWIIAIQNRERIRNLERRVFGRVQSTGISPLEDGEDDLFNG